jgi:hypothetical protein
MGVHGTCFSSIDLYWFCFRPEIFTSRFLVHLFITPGHPKTRLQASTRLGGQAFESER